VAIGRLTTTTREGGVYIDAQTNGITDAGDTGGEDIFAGGLILDAGTSIGTDSNPLEINVDTLSTTSSGTGTTSGAGTFLLETNAVTVDSVTVGTDYGFTGSAAGTDTPSNTQEDLNSANHLVLRTVDGSITVTTGGDSDDPSIAIDAAGRILLKTAEEDEATDATIEFDNVVVESGESATSAGAITLDSADNLDLLNGSKASVLGNDSTTGNLVALAAGDLTMAGDSPQSIFETANNANIFVATGGNAAIGLIDAGTGNIRLEVLGKVTDNSADSSASLDLAASSLLVDAGGIGESSNPIETSATTIALRGGTDGIFLDGESSLTVSDVTVTTSVVQSDGNLAPSSSRSLSDVITSGNGDIVIRAKDGDFVLNDGSEPDDGVSVQAGGSGNLLLEAVADGTSLTANAAVKSGTGDLTLKAHEDVTLNAEGDLSTGGDGTIVVLALNGSLTMDADASITTASGDQLLNAGDATDDTITLGDLVSTSGGSVAVDSSGAIVDADAEDDTDREVTAAASSCVPERTRVRRTTRSRSMWTSSPWGWTRMPRAPTPPGSMATATPPSIR